MDRFDVHSIESKSKSGEKTVSRWEEEDAVSRWSTFSRHENEEMYIRNGLVIHWRKTKNLT